MIRLTTLTVIIAMALHCLTPATAGTLYSTGFESPPFVLGQQLAGQDNWAVQVISGGGGAIVLGQTAAVISSAHPNGGLRSVQVNGSALTNAGNGFDVGSYRQIVNFDASNGLPLVRVQADVRLDGPATAPTDDLLTGDFFNVALKAATADGLVSQLEISSDGHGYASDALTSYLFDRPIALGQYNQLSLDMNFAAKTTTFRLNGQIIGARPFSPNFDANSMIFSRGSLVIEVADPDSLGRSRSSYTAYVDNFSMTASAAPAQQPCIVKDLYALGRPGGFTASLDIANITSRPGQIVGEGTASNGSQHALLWSGPAGAVADLQPTNLSGFSSSMAYTSNGSKQAGWATLAANANLNHAMLWSGSGDSAIDLNPTNLPGITSSGVFGINAVGTQEVGTGGAPDGNLAQHALLWSGTANSTVDLSPTSLDYFSNGSAARATDGVHQVGEGYTDEGEIHALLWSGTAASAIDLEPTNLSGFIGSSLEGVSGNQQIGEALVDGPNSFLHAMLWNGTANSAVDLNPTNLYGFTASFGKSTNGVQQAGTGQGPGTGNLPHALLWSGTADSAVDLQTFLPAAFTQSEADWIDAQGNVYGEALDSSGTVHAIRWLPILPGDFDGNGVINGSDLAIWKSGFGTASGAQRNQGDANRDGRIDGADFLAWQWNASTVATFAALSVLPEAATGRMFACGSLVILAGSRLGKRRPR